ncbi:flagellin lysine-N-methylase [uncultured Clostridium sp.]|uniref:flagellin lysine-N-methylase n=1 Tax=uncultured Clostridium sp. TaxID=59620 RepID=UPI00267217D1|nr:flagellin lysine-N-methylase [uncultured Clostridium sp.]
MKVLKPFYYDDFKCIAGNCIDNCCNSEWEISIDKSTYKKYKRLRGQWGNKIKKNICKIRNNNNNYLRYGKIKLKNSRCSLLSEEGLCSIHANLGVGYLCNTCKVYPRQIIKYGKIYERNLFMSCPEVARYFVRHKENFYFNMGEEELSDLDKDYIIDKSYDENLYNLLWDSRSLAMEIIQFKEIKIWKRIIFLKMLTDKVQRLIDEENYENYEKVLNVFRNEITNIDLITSLDKIKVVEEVKLTFIKGVLKTSIKKSLDNCKYRNLIKEYNELFRKNNHRKNELEMIIEKEKEFNIFLQNYENILENLLIYLIYEYFIQAVYTKNLIREINNIVFSYSIIRMLLLARWNKNNKKLEENDFVEIFYVFARNIEHRYKFLDSIYDAIKSAGYDSIAYTAILVR